MNKTFELTHVIFESPDTVLPDHIMEDLNFIVHANKNRIGKLLIRKTLLKKGDKDVPAILILTEFGRIVISSGWDLNYLELSQDFSRSFISVLQNELRRTLYSVVDGLRTIDELSKNEIQYAATKLMKRLKPDEKEENGEEIK